MTHAPTAEGALSGHQDVPLRAIAGREQAGIFFDDLQETITQLLDVLEAETELLRAGRVEESMALSAKKTALATTYARRVEILKANADMLGRLVPVEVDKLRRRREAMEQALRTNLAVLSAARAVSDALVKGVAGEVARKQSGPAVYGGNAARQGGPARAVPIAVDRAL
ncbi:MAG: flagellar protein FlgN [Rhodobiaceae bacterium]|nr:flagellar protein FlgN [Rhodobiaceae bacterium]MCC0055777.1 flagellar protein FlgN [Rhodobiaceae bacterium]